MKKVTKYVCGICHKEYLIEQQAFNCENSLAHKEEKKRREKENAEIKKWQDQGHDVWYEYSGMKHAKTVDQTKFGPHKYADHDGTSDCQYGCGCWMGPSRSGGPVNPFGACPKNPKSI